MMNKDRFIKWFIEEPDYRFLDDVVIKFTLKTVTDLKFSQNGATVSYEFWAHDTTTIRTDSALICVPYEHKANSCSAISFPKQIGLYKWTDRFEWKSSDEFEGLESNYEQTTEAFDVTLYNWSDPAIPDEVFTYLFESFPEDYKWQLGNYLIKNFHPLDNDFNSLPAKIVPFLQKCIKEHN